MINKSLLFLLSFSIWCFSLKGQITNSNTHFEEAYQKIMLMADSTSPFIFKDAVFYTENAFNDNQLSYDKFNEEIEALSKMARLLSKANEKSFVYDYKDRATILSHASIFYTLTDTVLFVVGSDTTINKHLPFTYDFFDIWGARDWQKMFVTKLLETQKGNCHSLPYLYKIVAENMGLTTHLALAPNHIYIKHRSEKTGMYNTELTSATFPIDAWLMTSGYIHLEAIQNGIYMEALNDKQSLALCLFDLAKGYQRKFGNSNDEFTMKCCEAALNYYPHFVNALLLKSSILKSRFDKYMREYNVEHAKEVFFIPKAKILFDEYEQLIIEIHQLGYRKMPEKMYLDWLLELKEHQEKYLNKEIIINLNTRNK